MLKPTLRQRVAPAVLTLAALVAIAPMLVRGPSCGHDFDFHVLSWLEAANQFAHLGYPHWAFTPAWNAGEPRFVFYPPLSWALGALLGMMLPWTFVPAAFTWIALTLSGLTMYRLASRYASPNGALLAATLYLANPYMLFTAYERTAYGELLAAAWLPLLFAAALPGKELSSFVEGGGPASRFSPILRVAIPLALLWLTNAPAAVMGSYALAFLMVLRLALPSSLVPGSSRLRLALSTTAGTVLGLALTGFYLIPAAYEQRFVQVKMAVIPGMRPAEHFLFHRMGSNSFDDLFHDQVVRTASIVALMMLAGLVVALIAVWRQKPFPSSLIPLPWLALLIAFLLTPPSLFLWNHIPKLAFLQFPWRLTALLSVIFATLVAQAVSRLRISSFLFPLPLSLLLILPAWHFFAQRCDFEDTVPARVALFHSNLGTEPTDEYTPVAVDGDAQKPGDPPYWLLTSVCPPPSGSNGGGIARAPYPALLPDTGAPPAGARPGQSPTHLTLDLAQPEYLILNRRSFPFWQVLINGRPTSLDLSVRDRLFGYRAPFARFLDWTYSNWAQPRPDGLIVLNLPQGHSTVDLVYRRTPDQTAGLIVSALAGFTTFGLALHRKPSASST